MILIILFSVLLMVIYADGKFHNISQLNSIKLLSYSPAAQFAVWGISTATEIDLCADNINGWSWCAIIQNDANIHLEQVNVANIGYCSNDNNCNDFNNLCANGSTSQACGRW